MLDYITHREKSLKVDQQFGILSKCKHCLQRPFDHQQRSEQQATGHKNIGGPRSQGQTDQMILECIIKQKKKLLFL